MSVCAKILGIDSERGSERSNSDTQFSLRELRIQELLLAFEASRRAQSERFATYWERSKWPLRRDVGIPSDPISNTGTEHDLHATEIKHDPFQPQSKPLFPTTFGLPSLQSLFEARGDPFNSFALDHHQHDARLWGRNVHDFPSTALETSANVWQLQACHQGEVIGSPTELRALLTAAALQLRQPGSGTSSELRLYELAALKYKTEATTSMNQALQKRITEQVTSAVNTLAINELQNPNFDAAKRHFQAAHQMIATIGGASCLNQIQLVVQDPVVENRMAGTTNVTFEEGDLSLQVRKLDHFLQGLHDDAWREFTRQVPSTNGPSELRAPKHFQVLPPGALFHQLLSEDLPASNLSGSLTSELVQQLAFLISLSSIWLEVNEIPLDRAHMALQNATLVSMGISRDDSVTNAGYLVMEGTGSPSWRKAYEAERSWDIIHMINVVRYLNFPTKVRLKAWLLRVLEGEEVSAFGKLDAFAFSYSCEGQES